MKREGRIHGTSVRLGKRAWGYGGHERKIIANKPTNKSKGTMKHPVVPAVAHIVYNEHELPLQKAIGKTKSAFKAKNLDITRNHMMQDWSLHDRGLAIEENYDYDDGGSDYYEDAYQEEAGEQWPSNDYVSGEEDEDEGEQEEEEEEPKSRRYRDRSEIVLPIESLLTNRKRKIAPKANALYLLEAKAVHQQQQLPETVGGDAGAEFAEIVLEGPDGNNNDELESWLGLGFYDGEEVPDDWFLITEEQEFVTV